MAALQDITLGRYIALDSAVHHLDPRTKFVATMTLMLVALSAHSFVPLLLFAAFLALTTALSKLPVRLVLANLRAFVWLFTFTFGLHTFLTPGQVLWTPPFTSWSITTEGLYAGAFFCLRLSTVVVAAALMTLTTAPMQLTAGLERLFSPAKRIGVPVAELALMISIALRFIPVLVDEAERLRKAQISRGADFTGNPIRRARSLIPLLVPLFVAAFERADRLALAMESRCYEPGAERTHYYQLALATRDFVAASLVLITIAAIYLSR
ncbi:MAG: energy-coupling factor transport system permease protein [Candidatus Latescibacterota bacterium]|jgi:energy-coupling factor transport system permease protein